MPEISVVILTWNRKKDLMEAIDSVLIQQGVSFEIIVVDSASTDGTRELITREYPQVQYICLPYNLGVIGGRNIGMANAGGEVIFLLDDDAVLMRTDMLQLGYQYFQRDRDLGIVFGDVYNYFNGEIESSVGLVLTNHTCSKLRYTHTFRAGVSFLRRELLDDIGYFDPLFFREGEERDLSLRALASGRRILHVPSIAIKHKVDPQRRSSGLVQSLKFLHELICLWTYYPAVDALFFSTWDALSELARSLKERWFLDYLRGLLLFVFRYLIFVIPKRRKPVSKELAEHIYALCTQHIFEPQDLAEARISRISYCRRYLRHLPLMRGTGSSQATETAGER
jgi:GT2 family glycosyltransferase